MIGRSTAEYFLIRTCILFLHSIPLVSILYSVQLLLARQLHSFTPLGRLPYTVQTWLTAEAVFLTAVFIPLRYALHRSPTYHRPMSAACRKELFRRCNTTIPNPEKYLSGWLMVSGCDYVRRDDVKDFIKWAFYGPNTQEQNGGFHEEIEAYTLEMEKMVGRRLPPGRTATKGLGQLLHEADSSYRCLLWYACVFVIDIIMYCKMLYNGFHFHRTTLLRFFTIFPCRPLSVLTAYRSPARHLTYWYRPHASKERLPILFIHGFGIGLYPYTSFLRDLNEELEAQAASDGEVGIIALEVLSVSSRITHPALEKDVMIDEIMEIRRYHGWNRFVLISHSYGSVIAAHLLKSRRSAPHVGPTVFIDPISFLLHLPDVAYNFIARQPVLANEYLLWYFGAKDVGVAHTLARRFCWADNIIWKEDLGLKIQENQREGRNVTVVLGGRDSIVNSEKVAQYLVGSTAEARIIDKEGARAWKSRSLVGNGPELMWYGELDHGQVFRFANTRRQVAKAVCAHSNAN